MHLIFSGVRRNGCARVISHVGVSACLCRRLFFLFFLFSSPLLFFPLFSCIFRSARVKQEYRFNWGKKTPPAVMFASMWGRASCRGVVEPVFQFHFSIWGKKTPPAVMVASMWGRASCRGVVEPIFSDWGKKPPLAVVLASMMGRSVMPWSGGTLASFWE